MNCRHLKINYTRRSSNIRQEEYGGVISATKLLISGCVSVSHDQSNNDFSGARDSSHRHLALSSLYAKIRRMEGVIFSSIFSSRVRIRSIGTRRSQFQVPRCPSKTTLLLSGVPAILVQHLDDLDIHVLTHTAWTWQHPDTGHRQDYK